MLRFVARLVDRPGRPPLSDLDRERTFTLSFFLADATLSMSEAPVPNSGIPGGKFLERGKVYKPRSPGSTKQERITEEDLWIGGVVELHGRAFELVSADERTRRALEAASLRAGHPCRK